MDIYRLLVRSGRDGMAAGDIAAELDIPAATLSFHLTNLRHAGLLDKRREGRHVFYATRYEFFSEIMRFLMENCCQGNPGACAFLADADPAKRCPPGASDDSADSTNQRQTNMS